MAFRRNPPKVSFFQLRMGLCLISRRMAKPVAFYSDKDGVFRVNSTGAVEGDGMTQFGRSLHALNIDILCANTPQARAASSAPIRPISRHCTGSTALSLGSDSLCRTRRRGRAFRLR